MHVCTVITLHLIFTYLYLILLLLEIQYSQHVQILITVADSKLLLLNHPPVLTTGCVWQLRLCQWPCELSQGHSRGAGEMPKLLYVPLCTPLDPLQLVGDITLELALAERGVGQAWWYTSTETKAYLIAARMLNYVVRKLLKYSWKTNGLIWHPTEGEELSQGLIQSDPFI